ncbi:MAG: caspase family protein [Rhizobacter sp.]|nr:caspase family protein [Rhizobacter sp.]
MPALRRCARITLLAGAALLAACASPPRGTPRVALVIGNGAYDNVVPLKNSLNDAADMCASLQRLGFKTLCHTNLRDRAEFDARVNEYLSQLDDGSAGVFYYAGHGVQAGGNNYLIPTQVQAKSAVDDPTRVLYGVDTLFERLARKRPRFQLVILDACREDIFSPPPRQRTRTAAAEPGRSLLVRALQNMPGGAGPGLQPIKDAPPSTIVLYATASKDTAFDGAGRNGPLTQHILEHIGTRGIYVEEFIKRVTADVERDTQARFRKRQTPYTYGSFSGKFCFAGCPGDSDVPLPPSF